MGMRMRVAVGYGLDISSLDKTFISKYNNMENKELFKAYTEEALKSANERENTSDYLCIHHALGTKHHKADNPPKSFSDMMDYDSEFAFEDKLLLYPLGYKKQFSRYSNLLDAFIYEATSEDWDMTPVWQEKPGTLYPFVGLMRANTDAPLGVEEYWETRYLDREETKNAIPMAPAHLWHLIKHLKLTSTDEETTKAFLSMRPTFMRWWS